MPLDSTPMYRDVMATHSDIVYAYVVLFVVDVLLCWSDTPGTSGKLCQHGEMLLTLEGSLVKTRVIKSRAQTPPSSRNNKGLVITH